LLDRFALRLFNQLGLGSLGIHSYGFTLFCVVFFQAADYIFALVLEIVTIM
jgi:hypothetical protein